MGAKADDNPLHHDRPAGGIPQNYIHLRDEKAQGTPGGTFTLGAWRTRDITTEVTDQPNACAILANQFSLDAGTYIIHASCPTFDVKLNQCKLYNISDAVDVIIGTYAYSSSAYDGMSRSFVVGLFTIPIARIFEIQHRCVFTKAATGFGQACNFTTEVYTLIELWKVA